MLKQRFQITDKLGEGGMGMVFKAIDLRKVEAKSHNPYIAIKVLHPDLAQNETLVAGLQRESEKAQQLSHPNIITVFDFDRDGDYVFMSMELLSGLPLNHIIRDSAPAGGLKLHRAWPIISQMAKALAYAHRKGIVHSDFKPANAFVTDDNEVKILDFGIAAKTGLDSDPDATVFNARAEGGLTPPYASFEMINGAKADPRDDIYAFGLVVYEMLSGKHPYGRKPASTVFIEQQNAANKNAPAPVKGLSRRQWQALKSSIELLQDKRPKSLDEWLREFEPRSRWTSPLWIGGVTGASLLAATMAWYWLQQTPPPAPPAETTEESQPPTVFDLPVAEAGSAQQVQTGQIVQLDGSASQSGDGAALNYTWRLLDTPSGSQAQLLLADSETPQLIPDLAGEYLVELTVNDQHNSSVPAVTLVTASAPPPAPLSHQTSSDDGLLSLAASKPQYRIGEKLRLNLHVAQTGYLRVAYFGANGDLAEILPNPNQKSKTKADTTLQIPPKGAKFDLQISGPVGKDKIIALFSQSPIESLEKIVDSHGDIADAYSQNASIAVIQYTVTP